MKSFIYHAVIILLFVCLMSTSRADSITIPPPPSSIEALKEFYDRTGGIGWHHSYSWLVIDEQDPHSVCKWRGVHCNSYSELGEDGNTYIYLYVEWIFLDKNNLKGSFPSMLAALPKLQRLNLDDNNLSGELPNSIGNFKSLRNLSVSKNKLKGSLPNISNLTNLRHLDLSHNELTGPLPRSYFSFLERIISEPIQLNYFSLAVNPGLKSPLGDWFVKDFPNLAAIIRMKGEDYGQTSFLVPAAFGSDSCFLPEKEIVALLIGIGWKADSCNTEDVSCPEGNTGPNCLVGNPMNIRNGVKQQTEVDYQSFGTFPLKVTRTYNSKAKRWQFNQLDAFLYDYGDDRRKGVTLGNGRSYFFSKATTDTWKATKTGNDSTVYDGYSLQKIGDGIRFFKPSGNSLDFNDEGRLIRINSVEGFALHVTKADDVITISDDAGQSIAITYIESNSNQPTSIMTPNGQLLYNYNEFDDLISVTYPDGKLKQYHYDENEYSLPSSRGLLTGITDESDVRFATWNYDHLSRVYKSVHGDNANITEIQYLPNDDNGRKVRMEYLPSGGSKKYYFDAAYGLRAEQIEHFDNQNTIVGTEYFTYNSFGHLSEYTDMKGTKTTYTRYTDGREVSRTIAAGTSRQRKISTTYVGHSNLPLTITTPELVTELTYNERNQLLTRTQTDRHRDDVRTITNTYNSQGLLASIDGPRTDVEDITTFDYDSLGRRIKTTNALGHTTEVLAFNTSGKPIKTQDANGILTTVIYDSRNRVTSITTNNLTTTFKYNSAGLQTQVTLPSGQNTYYKYDNAQRLIAIKDQLGNRINYRLDGAGNRIKTKIKDPKGVLQYTQKQVFDAFSRVKKIKSGIGSIEKFKYDAANQLTQEIDALGFKTKHTYDETGNVAVTRDTQGNKTHYDYDGVGRVATVKDAEGKKTYYQYNGFGELIRHVSSDTGTTTYQYNQAGYLQRKQQLSIEQTTTYQYDALNRLTYDSAHQANYTYDQGDNAKGQLTQIIDSSGKEQIFYDSNANIIRVLNGIGGIKLSIEYHYDDKNRLVGMTYPNAQRIDFDLNGLNQITAIKNAQQILSQEIEYLPFGPVKSLTYGNNLTLNKTFDLAYRQIKQATEQIEDKILNYNLTNNITNIDDLLGVNKTYSYSPMTRLTDTTGFTFTYDKIGNRQSKNNQVYTYANKSHQLLNAGDTTYHYNEAGQAVKKADMVFEYNDAGLIAKVTKGEQVASYRYNHRNQRVMKTSSSGVTYYVYDLSGKLIAEADEKGNVTTEYVYLHDSLITKIDNRETNQSTITRHIYFAHNNHINTPTKLTDISGNNVWQANLSPFGLGDINQDVDTDGQIVTLNIRFPGQYYDRETALHYNWHRYYDPQVGRYIQPDSIGLADGPSLYGYAHQNPINKYDPNGQNSLAINGGRLLLVPVPGARIVGGVLMIAGGILAYNELGQQSDVSEPVYNSDECGEDEGFESCEEEWNQALNICFEQIKGPNKRLTGNTSKAQECARGLVSMRCGGNRVE